MKKLIAISVVFALVAGVAFAVDLGASVIGTVKVIEADSDSSGTVTASGGFNQLRIHGSGELADGKFGGYIRLDGNDAAAGWRGWGDGFFQSAYAWWKPIDQLKLTIGRFEDGFFEIQGNSCWMFYQGATDTGVTRDGDAAWGEVYDGVPLNMRKAFAPAFDAGGLAIAISPVDMVDINIGIPFFNKAGDDIGDIFKNTYAQVALNMSFGQIAFTFRGADDIKSSTIFGFFALKAIDNLQIDFGLGTAFNAADGSTDNPLSIGLVVKYAPGTWGIKFRSLFAIPTADWQSFGMLFEFLPYFVINDNFRVFVSGGFAFARADDVKAGAGWHVNPYIEVGEEWGPRFLAGIKVWQGGSLASGGAPVNFQLPIALIVSF